MTSTATAARAAYLAYRPVRNAERRWFYALLLGGASAVYILSYGIAGELRADGQLRPYERYALAFTWLLAVGLCGVIAGRRPRAAWFDDGWVVALLAGAVALITLDAARLDVSGYVLIGLPVAVVHSAEPRRLAALQVGTLVAALAAIALTGTLAPDALGFMVTLGVCCATAVFVSVNVERARHDNFVASQALDIANRELEHRTEALARANAQLLASHHEMVAHSGELARVNAELTARGRLLEEANSRLEQLALTDPLTGVANRRQLLEALEREFGRSRRYGNALAIAVIDLDDFGQINKLHGVIAGDQALAGFAAALQQHVRTTDLAGRYGGEEFVVVLPDSSADATCRMLERLRGRLAATPLGSGGLRITFSAGVAVLAPDDGDPLAMLERADEAMRRAKREGKDRIVRATR